jgi:hypothetical protein
VGKSTLRIVLRVCVCVCVCVCWWGEDGENLSRSPVVQETDHAGDGSWDTGVRVFVAGG